MLRFMSVCLFVCLFAVTGFPKWASIAVVAVVVVMYTMMVRLSDSGVSKALSVLSKKMKIPYCTPLVLEYLTKTGGFFKIFKFL